MPSLVWICNNVEGDFLSFKGDKVANFNVHSCSPAFFEQIRVDSHVNLADMFELKKCPFLAG